MTRASSFWKGLVNASAVIQQWLCWVPGEGREVLLGRDVILGLGDRSLLSTEMQLHLRSLNFYNLAQVRTGTAASLLPDDWLSASDLQLSEPLTSEWNCYTLELKGAGISLKTEPDVLSWAGGDGSGLITAKNIYLALQNCINSEPCLPWLNKLWRLQMPLKLKLFSWLVGNNKLLTWEVLQRRGWAGPSICLLCKAAPENLFHLLMHCPFSKEVWHRITVHYNLLSSWSGSTILDSFPCWLTRFSNPPCLVIHFCWQIWLERNRVLFEDSSPYPPRVYSKILASFNWTTPKIRDHPHRAISFDLAEGHSIAFFDGAALANGSNCGAGGFFKSHKSRISSWFINFGSGTNTKAELLGLWTTLTLAAHWSLDALQVQGDSRVIIDWISNKGRLKSIHLAGWMQKTKDLLQGFSNISFRHVFRDQNRTADALSKRALSEEAGKLSIYHCDNGIESSITSFNIFV